MATKNQYAERIAYALNEPLNIMLRENIKFSLDSWRAMLIRQDMQQNGLSDGFLQRFDIELIKVGKEDSCNFNLDCVTVLKTKTQVPIPVRLKNDVLFKYVGDVTGKAFTYVEFAEIPYTCYNKYTSKVIRYNYTNNYLYVFNNTKLKWIRIQAVFENPSMINNLCDGTCYDEDVDNYPLPMDMFPRIMAGILSGEFKIQNPPNEAVPVQQPEITN